METPVADELRARSWDEFIGQQSVKRELDIRIRAAVEQKRLLNHVLLTGPPGFGKTTLGGIIAARLNDAFLPLDMPLDLPVLAREIRQFDGGVILLDEIHNCPPKMQNALLTLLPQDPAAGGYIQLPNGRRETVCATIIGATTEPEKLIPPLFARFQVRPYIEEYTDEEMGEIVTRMADRIGVEGLKPGRAVQLGRAAGGVPRNAGRLILGMRDLIAAGEEVTIRAVLNMAGVDENGLERYHIEILRTLDILGGQAGLLVLSRLLRLHPAMVTEYERLLIRQGLIAYGDRGREITKEGYRRLAAANGE